MTGNSQTEANRVNAAHSTGPRTEEGKAASSRNALKHGLAGKVLFIEGEDPAVFQQLLSDLQAEHAPATPTENILVDNLARHFWFSRRAVILQAAALDEDDLPRFALMLRYQVAADRAFSRTLSDLTESKKNRPESPIGFVSKSDPCPPVADNLPPQKPAQTGFVSQPPPATFRRDGPKIGRNEPCPCGSGRKWKKCCLQTPSQAA